jgi:hypothetical protein
VTADEVYQAWAPEHATWSRWVKPVLFAHVEAAMFYRSDSPAPQHPLEDMSWVPTSDGSNAIVVDLPGAQSVTFGLSLARGGYRPVPVFNSVPAPSSDVEVFRFGAPVVVEMREVVQLLIEVVGPLSQRNLPANAPPAFLLDSRRRGEGALLRPRTFDNRSVSLPTDFPSANFLLSEGVKRVLVVQAHLGQPQADLAHTLRRWQEAGIQIFVDAITDPAAPAPITVERPRWFRHLWYGLLARMGLRRNPLGGYGGFIPEPSSSS